MMHGSKIVSGQITNDQVKNKMTDTGLLISKFSTSYKNVFESWPIYEESSF